MAKRQRRKTSAATSMRYPQIQTTPKSSTSGRSAPTEFNPDYTAVKKDLRRIGILAGSFFVILVALSFILR
jgi:hypothetical protein